MAIQVLILHHFFSASVTRWGSGHCGCWELNSMLSVGDSTVERAGLFRRPAMPLAMFWPRIHSTASVLRQTQPQGQLWVYSSMCTVIQKGQRTPMKGSPTTLRVHRTRHCYTATRDGRCMPTVGHPSG